MIYYRMRFKAGNNGFDMWPACLENGVAAMTYSEISTTDFARLREEEFSELLGTLENTQQASLRRVVKEMSRGDVVYAMSGSEIVGRGVVTKRYKYRHSDRIVAPGGDIWGQQVRVDWERDFARFHWKDKKGAQVTVRILGAQEVAILADKAASNARAAESAEEKLAIAEGELAQATIKFRKRNRAIIAAKRRQCAGNMRCEVCGFCTSEHYRDPIRDVIEVHHIRPLSENGSTVVTTLQDLVLLCPNCHRAIHSAKGIGLTQLRGAIRQQHRPSQAGG